MEEIIELARRAAVYDKVGAKEAAVYFYREAAKSIDDFIYKCQISNTLLDDEMKINLNNKISEYRNRADTILNPHSSEQIEAAVNKSCSPSFSKIERCKFLISQALDADEIGEKEAALKLYMEAVEMSLKVKSEIDDETHQAKLTKLAVQALERAESLKGIIKQVNTPELSQIFPTTELKLSKEPVKKTEGGYSETEKTVLIATSRINNRQYLPFMSIDLTERFEYAIPFSDRDGPLALSKKQKRDFSHWARPEDLASQPTLIANVIDPFSIKQTIVSDCSFVASLAVGALYEKKFKKPLLTSIIYPQGKNKPLYNPFGKYMVKLHLNGVQRKVVIDDTLPVSRHGQLLCSFSTNRNEMWVSLLEKAYMKVMGGYDFPGSNSNIDLHALTGWIPERISLRDSKEKTPKDPERVFEMLLERHHHGDVLATVATGEIPEKEAERAGLVTCHAYALLDVRLVDGIKLVQLKNPWSHVRWRGKYSELDTVRWTPELQRALSYDPSSAATFDNGVFWIEWSSLIYFFDVLYLNWDPEMFSRSTCLHSLWSAGIGPVSDAYTLAENPQFILNIEDATKGAIWIVLTRHITDIEDFGNNSEFIALSIYKNKGYRVYYPYEPKPYSEGIRINSPHYLARIKLDGTENKYTLVVTQYEKSMTIYYTIRAYGTVPFSLGLAPNPYKHEIKEKNGAWIAGNDPPTYNLEIGGLSPVDVLIELRAPKHLHVAVFLSNNERKWDTGPYRPAFAALILKNLLPGHYNILPISLNNQASPFFIDIKSSVPVVVTKNK